MVNLGNNLVCHPVQSGIYHLWLPGASGSSGLESCCSGAPLAAPADGTADDVDGLRGVTDAVSGKHSTCGSK